MVTEKDIKLFNLVRRRVDAVLKESESELALVRGMLLGIYILGLILIIVALVIGDWKGLIPPSLVMAFLYKPIRMLIGMKNDMKLLRIQLGALPYLALIHSKKAYLEVLREVTKKIL